MIEELKKMVYAGIGATAVTYEKVESVMEDLVAKGKLSADDARQATDRVIKESKAEFEKSQSAIKDMFESLLNKADVATKKDIQALESRIAALEKQPTDSKKSS